MLQEEYFEGKQTVAQISVRYGISPCTVRRHLRAAVPHLVVPVLRRCVVLADATYFGRRFGVVLMKDARAGKYSGTSSSTATNVLPTTGRACAPWRRAG